MIGLKDIIKLRKALHGYSLTVFQLEILLAVEANEGLTLNEILNKGWLETDSTLSTIATPLQRLAEGTPRTKGRGFIKKVKSAQNANANELYLTGEGKKVLSHIKLEIGLK
ncbi:MarR family winged helix-turn-helix transcriptional regulator [Zooshikella ganghwensis]|uniref:MarR family winged helix-turn-helix transcriptional regulator n=1 Tax=Zooshikella ganghwensis TaxID=202772 RepID=UPI00040D7EBA|nr:MarR family winged helix-turn-helix transcriptional regulator [Zooshikella ganghwensis]